MDQTQEDRGLLPAITYCRHHWTGIDMCVVCVYGGMTTVSVPLFHSCQVTVTFGDAVICTADTVLGCETCEELFTGNRFTCTLYPSPCWRYVIYQPSLSPPLPSSPPSPSSPSSLSLPSHSPLPLPLSPPLLLLLLLLHPPLPLPPSPHIAMGLDGVEIFTNGSGSHHELRKLHKRVDLIRSATSKVATVNLQSDQTFISASTGGRGLHVLESDWL